MPVAIIVGDHTVTAATTEFCCFTKVIYEPTAATVPTPSGVPPVEFAERKPYDVSLVFASSQFVFSRAAADSSAPEAQKLGVNTILTWRDVEVGLEAVELRVFLKAASESVGWGAITAYVTLPAKKVRAVPTPYFAVHKATYLHYFLPKEWS